MLLRVAEAAVPVPPTSWASLRDSITSYFNVTNLLLFIPVVF